MKTTKRDWATIDGYSRTGKYTETFFHHPTKNNHYQTEYERKKGNKDTNTFRLKKTPEYKDYLYSSSLNQFKGHNVRAEKLPYEGQKKIMVSDQSFRRTDPVTLRFERGADKLKMRVPFEGSLIYQSEIERRHYLPAERSISKSQRLYHSQLGMSLEHSKPITPRSVINSSSGMRQTIQYHEHPLNRSMGSLDDFKYNSRK
jgi:hypothetical protein